MVEPYVIGGLLHNPGLLSEVQTILEPSDFGDESCRACYEAMLKLDGPITFVTVGNAMGDGWMAYLVEAQKNTPGSANTLHYARLAKENATRRELRSVAAQIAKDAESGTAVEEAVDKAQSRLSTLRRGTGEIQTAKEVLERVIDRIGKPVMGVSSGFSGISDLVGDFPNGDLVIIAGRPSMGKTTLAMNMAERAALSGKRVMVFSLEMSPEKLCERMLSSVSRVSANSLRRGLLGAEDYQKVRKTVEMLDAVDILIPDHVGNTVFDIKAQARVADAKKRLDLIVVDYLQLMDGKGENRTQQLSSISRGLKELAVELELPVIVLSQLNRGVEQRVDKRPMLSDLRESGAIEQDADIVGFVYRHCVYDQDPAWIGLGEFMVRKNRNGPIGNVKLSFAPEQTRFDDFEGVWPPLVETKTGKWT